MLRLLSYLSVHECKTYFAAKLYHNNSNSATPFPKTHLYFLPQVLRRVGPLDRLDVEVAHTVVLADGGVARIGERARALVAQPGNVVFISVLPRRRDT